MEAIDRKSAVAGQFYPVNPEKLQKALDSLFAEAIPKQHQNVRAIISPHAGYVFSGKVAASTFNQIDGEATYKRVFLLASSHEANFGGAAVYCDGDFEMPYGKVPVDTVFGKRLVERYPEIFSDNRKPHIREHSLEVQLPFLHQIIKTAYWIVPIIIGTSDPSICQDIAKALKPWFNENNLFIISSDFSHYPKEKDAQIIDELTKEAILSNDPEKLLTTLAENDKKRIYHLATSLCGWTSVLTLLYMTAGNLSMKYHAIAYQTSANAINYGNPDRVVGYWGISVSEI